LLTISIVILVCAFVVGKPARLWTLWFHAAAYSVAGRMSISLLIADHTALINRSARSRMHASGPTKVHRLPSPKLRGSTALGKGLAQIAVLSLLKQCVLRRALDANGSGRVRHDASL
jgi:hypothetical protein